MEEFNFNDFEISIAEVLEINKNDINDEILLNDSTLDSLSVLTIIAIVDDLFSLEINAEELFLCKNIFGLKKYIFEKKN